MDLLKSAGITTMQQFFEFLPRAHEDRQHLRLLNELASDQDVYSVKGKILDKKMLFFGGKKRIEFLFEDPNGQQAKAVFYNATFIWKQVEKDAIYIFVGKPKFIKNQISFWHPEMIKTQWFEYNENPLEWSGVLTQKTEILEGDQPTIGRLYPIYTEIAGIKSSWFAKKTWDNLHRIPEIFREYLPELFLKEFGVLDICSTIKQIHYPDSPEMKQKAVQRIFFDRLLRVQISSQLSKELYQSEFHDEFAHGPAVQPDRETVKRVLEKLPFELTNAQKKVLKHVIEDFHSHRPMLRLLQWDVGSWKTIVAAVAAYYIIKKFWAQVAFLAPLEVLAQQHYKSMAKVLLPLGVNLQCITGSVTKSQKEKLKADLLSWTIDLIIWTHAVLQEDVQFKKLLYVVIDEQHKFWVKQRSFFRRFQSPHILQMSATPIPRSMALAFFGEFDVSIIDEMPQWRKPIITKIISEKELIKLKQRVLTKISQNQQVFIVTPLIEESEKMENIKSVLKEFEEICDLYPELHGQIGLLHGKLKPKEKDQIMNFFKEWKFKILVSTTVIEVGVDVPQASIMIIKNAERFGLSQLHQLRGRVGRSDIQSYCFLETRSKTPETMRRLKALEETNDGFKLAELDLHFRGAGEILGLRQSGESDLPLEILADLKFLEKVQDAAKWLLERYPNLDGLPELKARINESLGDIMA